MLINHVDIAACPPGFTEDRGQCYKHIRFQQSIRDTEERSICPRMHWVEEVHMSYPRSFDELYLLQNLKEK